MRSKQSQFFVKGFTLVELLVALSITGIILAAVATAAFAMSTANDSSDDTSEKQARIRYATFIFSDLIRNSRLICASQQGDILLWKSDDDQDDQIDVAELAYIESGSNNDYLKLLQITSCPSWLESSFESQTNIITELNNNYTYWKNQILANCGYTNPEIIDQCSNVVFNFDNSAPDTEFVNISFELIENGILRQYEITATIRCMASNLLNSSGTDIISDDD